MSAPGARPSAAHAVFFADHPPPTTMVEVTALIDPPMLIEIEADAYGPGGIVRRESSV